MKFWTLFAGAKPAPKSQPARRERPNLQTIELKREILNMALKDTVVRHGVPPAWMVVELAPAPMLNGRPQWDARLVVREWSPRLMQYSVAFEKSFMHRISVIDATWRQWLKGCTWQMRVRGEPELIEMPDPKSWLQSARPAEEAQAAAAPPVRHGQLEALRAMMNRRDEEDFGDDARPDFQNTQPFDRPELH
ncbi:hypothetical protein [Ramlibacter humi]|uniref:Uncharacterized protein n=1 Tax=Ramlibacter humi TaxID=2530451 RepID=A0A4Z0BFE5_9BURK|nr:hypothetical protein [Ramlibacter humi]TFY97037.1 hypothetical protein EZ216_19425 [Ramlibacter humi]